MFAGNAEEVQSANEYDSIATGNIESALDQLQGAQDALQSRQASLRQQQTQDQADEVQQATALTGAEATQNAMELEQAQITGQLATAVAAQAARPGRGGCRGGRAKAAGRRRAQAGKGPGRRAQPRTPARGRRRRGRPARPGRGRSASPIPRSTRSCSAWCRRSRVATTRLCPPTGLYMGAFQFSQSTWNFAALAAALSILVNCLPTVRRRPNRTPWPWCCTHSTVNSPGSATAVAPSRRGSYAIGRLRRPPRPSSAGRHAADARRSATATPSTAATAA